MKKSAMFLLFAFVALVCGTLCADTVYPRPEWRETKDPSASEFAVKGGIIRIFAGPAPKSLNYYVDSSVYISHLFDLMYSPLLGLDPTTLEFVPALADRWTISDDGCVFTFHIDPRAKWSDGKPVSANDVVWTYDAIMNPTNQTGPFKVSMEKFSRPEAIDPQTVRFRAKENHWHNLSACGCFSIMPEHAYSKMDFNRLDLENPVVSGPYTISEVRDQRETRLSRRLDWWAKDLPRNRGLMNFDTIIFRYYSDRMNAFEAFKKGQIDVYPVYSARLWAVETMGEKFDRNWIVKQNVNNSYSVGFQGFAMNLRRAPFDDVRVRKAFAHLVDRQTMIRTMMYNAYFLQRSYCEDLYDSSHPCRNPVYEFNPEKAEALLREAGYARNPQTGLMEKNGIPLSFTFLTRDAGTDRFLAVIDRTLRKLGITMKIDRKDWATWMRDMDEFNFDVTWAAWGGVFFRDPEGMWSSKEARRQSSSNVTGFSDPRVDRLIEAQKSMNEIGDRNEIMRKIDAILTEEVPYVLLWNSRSKRLLYWNTFGMPDTVLPKFGGEMAVLSHWWYDDESASELKSAMKSGMALGAREENVYFDRQEKE